MIWPLIIACVRVMSPVRSRSLLYVSSSIGMFRLAAHSGSVTGILSVGKDWYDLVELEAELVSDAVFAGDEGGSAFDQEFGVQSIVC